jgi:hypothetical protein
MTSTHQENEPESLILKIYFCEGITGSNAELLQLLLPEALQDAIECKSELRAPLPRNFFDHIGVAHSEKEGENRVRDSLFKHIENLVQIVSSRALDMLDPATDQVFEIIFDNETRNNIFNPVSRILL